MVDLILVTFLMKTLSRRIHDFLLQLCKTKKYFKAEDIYCNTQDASSNGDKSNIDFQVYNISLAKENGLEVWKSP